MAQPEPDKERAQKVTRSVEERGRSGMIHLLRDCVSVGLVEAFDRPPARQRLRARVGDGEARRLIPSEQRDFDEAG